MYGSLFLVGAHCSEIEPEQGSTNKNDKSGKSILLS